MSMTRKVQKVGGSLAVIIPRDIAELLGLRAGSPVMLDLEAGRLTVTPRARRRPRRAEPAPEAP